MLDERFVILGVVISFLGGLSYLLDTLKGKAKPNRITWFFWALAPLIAFAAELEKGVGLVSSMTFMIGFSPLMIFLASFVNKQAYWELKKIDYFYGALSLVGLILWKITGEGNIAIFVSMISASITLLAIKNWTFAHWGFPIYIFIICALVYILVKFKLGLVLQKKKLKQNSNANNPHSR